LRELLEMSATRQRTSPDENGSKEGLKAMVRNLKDEAEMEAIAKALEKTNWSRKEAARQLGISYKALLYKMRQYKLDTGRAPRSSSVAGPSLKP
jgi:DNA-binding NtrC family response regulator